MVYMYHWIHPGWDHQEEPEKSRIDQRLEDQGGGTGLAPAGEGPSAGTRTPYLAPPDARQTLYA